MIDCQCACSKAAGVAAVSRHLRGLIDANNMSLAGAVDMHIHQSGDYPQFNVDVDRTKAALVGLTEQSVAGNMLVCTGGGRPGPDRGVALVGSI